MWATVRMPFHPRVRNGRICLRTRSWICTLAQHLTPGQRIYTLATLLISAALYLEVLGISFLTASITSSRARSDCLLQKRFRTRIRNAPVSENLFDGSQRGTVQQGTINPLWIARSTRQERARETAVSQVLAGCVMDQCSQPLPAQIRLPNNVS